MPAKPAQSLAAAKAASATAAVAFTSQALAAARVEAARHSKVDRSRYEIVRTAERLNAWIARALDLGTMALGVAAGSADPMRAPMCGFSLAVGPNEACYVPLAHRQGGDGGLFAGDLAPDQLPESVALRIDETAP